MEERQGAAKIGEGFSAQLLNGMDRVPCTVGLMKNEMSGSASLDHYGADALGDDVLHLASDPCPLLLDRRGLMLLVLADQAGRQVSEGACTSGPFCHHQPDTPGHDDSGGEAGDVATEAAVVIGLGHLV